MQRTAAIVGYRERITGLAVTLTIHAGLLLLVLTAAPQLPRPPDDPALRVFEVRPPPPPPPVAIAEPVPPRPAVRDPGGGRHSAAPIPLARPAPASTVVPDVTPMQDAPAVTPSRPVSTADLGDAASDASTGIGATGGSGSGKGIGSGEGTGPKPARWARTEWIATPTTRAFHANWPPGALARKQSGEVTLSCTIRESGRPRRCVIVSESPVGAGFGAAALRMSPDFRIRPVRRNGRTVDMPVLVPLAFIDHERK